MRYYEHGGMGGGWTVLMVISMLAFWVLVALAIVWFARTVRTPTAQGLPPAGAVTGGAEQILAERLARGEIEPEDYEARLKALKSPG